MANLRKAHTDFVEFLGKEDRSQATILAYGTDIRQLIDFVEKHGGKADPQELAYEDLQGFLASLEGEYTKKSISRKINSIRTFFRFLKDTRLVIEDPAARLTHPKFEIKPPRILSQMEYRALRDVCREDKRMYAIVEILLQTGIRIGELRQIHLGDVHYANDGGKGVLLIRDAHRRPAREVPLNQAAQKAIKDYLEVRPESDQDFLFVTRPGNPYLIRNIRAAMNRYFKRGGVTGATVNDLRHTFIANHLSRGADVAYISKLVGHKRLTSTEKYLEYVERPEEETRELEEL